MVSLETLASQNIGCETFFVQKTFISNPAIAVKISFTGIENFLVVLRYNRFHVSHTAITYFSDIKVEYFVNRMSLCEMAMQKV